MAVALVVGKLSQGRQKKLGRLR